jgi:hypothetical protein
MWDISMENREARQRSSVKRKAKNKTPESRAKSFIVGKIVGWYQINSTAIAFPFHCNCLF